MNKRSGTFKEYMMTRRRTLPIFSTTLFRLLIFVSLAALLIPAWASAAPATSKTISIAEARELPLGTIVTVDGSVTVPSGAFRSGTFDEGFAIADRTGGIYVSVNTNLGLDVRQQVRVTGQLAEMFGLLILVPTDVSTIKVHGRGPKVTPEPTTTGAISEATEGRLVQVTGTITQPVGDDMPYGYRIFIDDGSGEVQVFVYASTGIDVSGLQPGMRISVVGFSGQFDDHYEINPRFPADIRILN